MDIFFQAWVLMLESLIGCLQKATDLKNYRLFFYPLHQEEFGKNINFQFQNKKPPEISF